MRKPSEWLLDNPSPASVTGCDDPGETLARIAALQGTHACWSLGEANIGDEPYRYAIAEIYARTAWRFAEAALTLTGTPPLKARPLVIIRSRRRRLAA